MKQLLFSITKKDLEIQTFRSGGPGGQHQNKTDSGVRIIHRPSGAVGESRSERSQRDNKRIAFRRMMDDSKLKLWINRMAHERISGETIEQKVEKQMAPQNLRVEYQDEKGKFKASPGPELEP